MAFTAEIFIEERKSKIKHNPNFLVFVDDFIAFYIGAQPRYIFSFGKDDHPNIKFTMELGGNIKKTDR